MMNISKITKVLSLVLATAVFILVSGDSSKASAQRDPFIRPGYSKPQTPQPPSSGNPSTGNPGNPGNPGNAGNPAAQPKPVKQGPMVVPAPPIEARIDYYKRVREEAATNGVAIPKVTSVLLVNEMSVTGIFKTPRGYAAMVEATPIKLSYTIYPGEKFFDGQLVAVEENRLVFRKVTKWSNNKFISSVENKPLREYTLQQEIQGTSPVLEPYDQPAETNRTEAASNTLQDPNVIIVSPSSVIISPLEEMNNQPTDKKKDSAKKESERDKKGKKRASNKKKRP